jgi:hypothetical protein
MNSVLIVRLQCHCQQYKKYWELSNNAFLGYLSPATIKSAWVPVWCAPCDIETEECWSVYGLVQTYNLAKQIVMTDKSLRSLSVYVSAAVKYFRDQTQLISYEAMHIKYYERVCLYSWLSYPACKSRSFAPCYFPTVAWAALLNFYTFTQKRHNSQRQMYGRY